MESVWIILQIVIGYNLVLPIILYLLLSLKTRKPTRESQIDTLWDYAIVVTAYEQTHMLPAVLESILQLNYKQFHVYVVADNCDISTLNISDPRVSVLRPDKVLSSNVKSHFYAIERFVRKHDIITIIDSDNLVHIEYINELNVFFNQGFDAVQGVRQPKELKTTIACLDAARDLYYNFYDGKVLFELGSSSTLAGSGMAFGIETYINSLKDIHIVGAGFDKVLQGELLNNNLRIAYAADAIVYDEKTSQGEQLINQRSRWINTWFKYNGLGRRLIFTGIVRRNLNQFLFGIVLVRPPLFLFIVASLICLCYNIFANPIYALVWIIAFILFIIGFSIALAEQKTDRMIYKSLRSIPKFVFYQLISLYFSRIANKRSVATKH